MDLVVAEMREVVDGSRPRLEQHERRHGGAIAAIAMIETRSSTYHARGYNNAHARHGCAIAVIAMIETREVVRIQDLSGVEGFGCRLDVLAKPPRSRAADVRRDTLVNCHFDPTREERCRTELSRIVRQ
jgi:hypothetical protein